MGFLHHLFHSHHGRHGYHGHHRGGRHGHRGHHRHQHSFHQRQGGRFDDEGAFFGAAGEKGGAAEGDRFDRFDHLDGIDRIDYLAQKVARRLDLNNEQLARLKTLIECLQQQRQAVRGGDLLQEAGKLFDAPSFDRTAAQALVDARIALLQAAVPAVLDAMAGFYDALDVEQQQVLRFFIRLGRRARDRHEAEGQEDSASQNSKDSNKSAGPDGEGAP